jgi:hypothetical protein
MYPQTPPAGVARCAGVDWELWLGTYDTYDIYIYIMRRYIYIYITTIYIYI